MSATNQLIERIRQGDRRALARGLSLLDQAAPEAAQLADWLRRHTGQTPWWGLTGPPGVGKSTLIDALLTELRARQRRVGVVAVDPTSRVSGGALLGDRVRMMRHAADAGVFIRSLATRQCAGGLSDATLNCARLLEAAGYDPVLLETVGVGQTDAELAAIADLCLVVLGPGYGDDIQLLKAGLLELADIVVVNKCDEPEANRLLAAVSAELAHLPRGCDVGLLAVSARTGQGLDELLEKLLVADARLRGAERRREARRRRLRRELRQAALRSFEQRLAAELTEPAVEELLARVERGELELGDLLNAPPAILRRPDDAPGRS